jgi:RHS repeat-associated protein
MQYYMWNGMGYTLNGETQYVYDGWRVIQERNSGGTPVVSYTRGSDLSGSMEGAGGIGGLLARSHGYSSGNWSTHSYYHADGNGNITYLLNAGESMVASYKYDAYGNTLASSGSLAGANNYRFSSKERIPVQDIYGSELYYYGYRFYQPSLQRWLTRDPIEELGGINLYGFVGNEPIKYVDLLGLAKDLNCVSFCFDNYGFRFSLGTGLGGLWTGATWPKPPPGTAGRLIWQGRLTKFGGAVCKAGYGAAIGVLADNVGEDGFFALLGCLSGCPKVPDVPDCPQARFPWGQDPMNCNMNSIPVINIRTPNFHIR